MVPAPQESVRPSVEASGKSDTSIVISGISGAFPKCHTVKDLSDVLYNKIDPLLNTKPRWEYSNPEVPPCLGRVPDVDQFDGQFFKTNAQLVRFMDPMSRMMMEHCYRAIYDAGLSADQINGRNIAVYVASGLAESEKHSFYNFELVSPSSLVGSSKAMFANRISYWLNLKGPSMQINCACMSAVVALEHAYYAIKRGDCEAALVASARINLHPQTLIHFGRLIHSCRDGKTKSYNECADGCVKSEAISAVFIQKAEDALRILSEIVHVKTETNFYVKGDDPLKGLERNPKQLADFIKRFYKETNVSPNDVEYVEGFGAGDFKVDKAELEAIEEVYCKDRSKNSPLLVGSVMSNIGYSEGCSGLTSITKVILGYKKGELAANLHCPNPRQDIAALRDGRMKIVNEHTPFNRNSYAAVNVISATGVNGHILLRGHYIPKPVISKPSIPLLVTISGRQESAVTSIIDDLSSRPIDAEEIALLHNIHEEKNTGHLGRGFVLLDTDVEKGTVCKGKSVEHFDDMKRPLWFVYSGMGSQWAGMGKDLMRIPTFAAAIERCRKVLEPKGVDIVHIITSPDKTIYDNILNSFVGIAAVQIGLTDVLFEMGIVPDKIIGHSVGELGCSYADGCFTAEEMILAAYSRGLVSIQTKFIRGSMAAVGVGYQKALKLLPPEIEVACHNGPDSCTISGPADVMCEFVPKLTAQGIFAKEVPCSNIAYHSRYIADAGPQLLEYLTKVIKNPKRRSERWLSSSVPEERWEEENAQYSSAWYHTNNLLSSVLFEETSRHIPPGAVTIEIAPHGLLQAILKRSLHPDCRHIPLTRRGHQDNVLYLLEAVGKIFMQGYNPKVKNLYPKVEFPVSSEAPLLSHLVEFTHTEKFPLPLYRPIKWERSSTCRYFVSTHDEESSYLRGNVVRGENLYPFAAVLVSVWETFAMINGVPMNEMSVQFREVHLLAQPMLLDKRYLEFNVTIHKGTGEFEVMNLFSKVATGVICEYTKNETLPKYETAIDVSNTLDSDGIYKLFQERDYSYSDDFCSIFKSNYSFTEAELLWNGSWVTLLDGMLQLNALCRDHDTVSQPSYVHRMVVDVKSHSEYQIQRAGGYTVIPASRPPIYDCTRCGGIFIEKVRFFDLLPLRTDVIELKTLLPRGQTVSKKKNTAEYESWKENVAVIRDAILQSGTVGDLNSLSWVEAPEAKIPPTSGLLVTVRFAGLNLYDVNVATGVITSKKGYLNRNVYGMDYSGTTVTGEQVMGIVRGGAASASVNAVPELMWPVPEHWTLEDAATVPLAYAQAFYCLGIKAPLYPGMTIFVHGGAGALGQAVISIALANQCKVFTTVSDVGKKQLLLKLFPELTEDVIGYSRDHSFADLVRIATNGLGCDIVITCATGNLKTATLDCGSFGGIIFDMVQAHSEEPYGYGMHYLTKQRSYMAVDFFRVFENVEYAKMIQSMMSEGIARGYVRPLSRVTYAAQDAVRAFRLLAAQLNRGRVLLRLRDSIIPAQPRFTCSSHLYQIVVCREDSLSLQFVDRLIKCGAKKLLLHHSQPSALLSYKIKCWQNLGVEVRSSAVELSCVDKAKTLFDAGHLEVEGVFIVCAGEAQDSTVISNIDIASRIFNPILKHFAVISTKASLDENACLDQTRLNLPATMISLGKLNKTNNPNVLKIIARSNIMNIIERALYSTKNILVADFKRSQKPTILEVIREKTTIKELNNVTEDTTLRELGLDERYLEALGVVLQYNYHVSIPAEKIPKLTLRMIRHMDNLTTEPQFEETTGLSAFFSYIESDECLGATEMAILPTLIKYSDVREDEVNLNLQYMWIVSGLEGNNNKFRTLCQRLKLPALVLQPGVDNLKKTIQEQAQKYVEILTARTNLKKNQDFYLLGFEAGVNTAFEMAAILEEQGLTGTVYCVGGCPEEMSSVIANNLKDLDTEEKLQIALTKHLINIMSTEPIDDSLASDLLSSGTSWQETLDKNLQKLMKNSPQSTSYAQKTIEAAYARLKQILHYKASSYKLRSRIIVLRSAVSLPGTAKNVDSLSERPVKTFDLPMPLSHILEHPRCASIINSFLGKDLLDKYEATCETYPEVDDYFQITLDLSE